MTHGRAPDALEFDGVKAVLPVVIVIMPIVGRKRKNVG